SVYGRSKASSSRSAEPSQTTTWSPSAISVSPMRAGRVAYRMRGPAGDAQRVASPTAGAGGRAPPTPPPPPAGGPPRPPPPRRGAGRDDQGVAVGDRGSEARRAVFRAEQDRDEVVLIGRALPAHLPVDQVDQVGEERAVRLVQGLPRRPSQLVGRVGLRVGGAD